MRRLRRPRFEPPTMADSGVAGRRRLSDRQEYERTAVIPNKFPPHWTAPDVRGSLSSMQGRICAYCARETGLDVDHFRPKGGYWWLAYDYSNYFLACNICNQKRKGNSFPLAPAAARCTYETRDAIESEERLLFDPAQDPIEEWLTIGSNDLTGKLIPHPTLDAGRRERVQKVIDLLGMNIDPLLRKERSFAYEKAVRDADQKRWDKLRGNAMRHRPHSLIARIVLQIHAPDYLPTPEEEVTDLIGALWQDLRNLVRELNDLERRATPARPMDRSQLHSLVWALIALRADPHAGDPDTTLTEMLEHEEMEMQSEIISLFRACRGQD